MLAIKYKKLFFVVSGSMMLASFIFMFVFGFNISTDFKGGTIVEVEYKDKAPEKIELEKQINKLSLGGVSIRESGEKTFILRTKELSIQNQEDLKNSLKVNNFDYEIKRFSSVGPLVGKELQSKALIAIVIVILITIIYIAFAFRGISKPARPDGSIRGVSSWVYGLIAILALIHDITIPTGVAVLLGKFGNMEIDALFITALLSLLGYSINDTIVIFDKIRENLHRNKERNNHESFENTVGRSLSETYERSINTSLTVFLVLVSLLIFGGSSIYYFILTLIVGTIAGAYSSIFLAGPMLVWINKRLVSRG